MGVCQVLAPGRGVPEPPRVAHTTHVCTQAPARSHIQTQKGEGSFWGVLR